MAYTSLVKYSSTDRYQEELEKYKQKGLSEVKAKTHPTHSAAYGVPSSNAR